MLAGGDGECRDRDGDGHRVHHPGCAGGLCHWPRGPRAALDLGRVQRGWRGRDHLGGGGRACDGCDRRLLGRRPLLDAGPGAGDDGGGAGEDVGPGPRVLGVLVRRPRHVHVVREAGPRGPGPGGLGSILG